MAMMFPENPELVNTSEKLVYEKLVDLPDSWHIYSNMQQHITLYENVSRGEIDFILTHPHLGIVLIEVKGYGIFYENNTWLRTDSDEGGRSFYKKNKKSVQTSRASSRQYVRFSSSKSRLF